MYPEESEEDQLPRYQPAGVRMYPQQYNHEDQDQDEESNPVPKVDPRTSGDAAKSIEASDKAKQYQEEDEARYREIQKKFDEKTKDMSKRYA